MMRLFVDTMMPEAEFTSLLSSLTPEAQTEVMRFVRLEDRMRALCSRLLVRHVVSKACNVSPWDVSIERTKGGKPYSLNESPSHSPNFNFNVSHDGRLAVIASEGACICGVDVAGPLAARRRGEESGEISMKWLQSSFSAQLSTSEWSAVEGCRVEGGIEEMAACFQRFWSLKEAYVKARGDGLGFGPLSRVEFTLTKRQFLTQDAESRGEAYEATGKADGVSLHRWRFSVESLEVGEHSQESPLPTGGSYVVAVALGPPEDVVDELGKFKQTFKCPLLTDVEMEAHLNEIRPRWKQVRVQDILKAPKDG